MQNMIWTASSTTTILTPSFSPSAAEANLYDTYRVKSLHIRLVWRPASLSDSQAQMPFAVAFDPSLFSGTPSFDVLMGYSRNSRMLTFDSSHMMQVYHINDCTNELDKNIDSGPIDCTESWTVGAFAAAPVAAVTATIMYEYVWDVEFYTQRSL